MVCGVEGGEFGEGAGFLAARGGVGNEGDPVFRQSAGVAPAGVGVDAVGVPERDGGDGKLVDRGVSVGRMTSNQSMRPASTLG
jgi:hypothetical protein